MKKKLIIVGGGFAGINLAKKTRKKFDVTLIDKKSYFEFTPSIPKVLVDPKKKNSIQFEYSKLKKIKFIRGTPWKFSKNKLILLNGDNVSFDFLTFSTGSKYKNPLKEYSNSIQLRTEGIENYSKKIKEANKIVIIGAGIVGIEIAGEIISKYPHKKITLIQKSKTILPRNNNKTKIKIKNFLELKGVEILEGESYKKIKENLLITDKREINFDLIIFCWGIEPDTNFFPDKNLDDLGFVKINKNFNIKMSKNIFAIGDIISIREEKMAQAAIRHSNELAKFLIKSKKRNYLKRKNPQLISLGKKGILEIKNFSYFGKLPLLLKTFIERRYLFSLKR